MKVIPRKEKPASTSSLATHGPAYRLTLGKIDFTDKSPTVSAKRPAGSGFSGMSVNLHKLTGSEPCELLFQWRWKLDLDILQPQGANVKYQEVLDLLTSVLLEDQALTTCRATLHKLHPSNYQLKRGEQNCFKSTRICKMILKDYDTQDKLDAWIKTEDYLKAVLDEVLF